MNLNPKSPFSGKPLSDCPDREVDAWCAMLCGITPFFFFFESASTSDDSTNCHDAPHYTTSWAAAGPLMERDEWPENWVLVRWNKKRNIWCVMDSKNLFNFISGDTGPAAITRALVVAAEHKKENAT